MPTLASETLGSGPPPRILSDSIKLLSSPQVNGVQDTISQQDSPALNLSSHRPSQDQQVSSSTWTSDQQNYADTQNKQPYVCHPSDDIHSPIFYIISPASNIS